MVNERKTENLVRKLLSEQGYYDDEYIVVEEQSSDNPKIDKLLKSASKSGVGKGYPEFIISFKNNPENLIVIECKASLSKHESEDRKSYKDYAVDGALLYASYLKDHFNVMAIAVSGETEREIRISHFLWVKNKVIYKDVNDKQLLSPKSLFNIIEIQSAPIRDEELIKKAIEYNKELHDYSIPEVERCTVISSILVALQDTAFVDSYKSFHKNDPSEEYNPNSGLINALLAACDGVLIRNNISPDKRETILGEYNKIKQSNKFKSKRVLLEKNKKVEKINTILRDLIDDINQNVMPYVNNGVFDVLGQFYTQFIRYSGSDSKTGLVLTPAHITNLFCDLAEVNENDIIFDPCCGTGGFLVAAMKYMLNKSGNDIEKHKKIKSDQLIGVEARADMFSHACSNMMMRGDGKSHIHFGDCFQPDIIKSVKEEGPTKAFLNPPYDVGEVGQLAFIENSLDCLRKDGVAVAICQMSVAVSAKSEVIEIRKRILDNHTLLAVLSMPDELFNPVGVITCILLFKAKAPHSDKKKTFFGYFKDDGFVKAKNKGRIDSKKRWEDIKSKWLEAYFNHESIPGLSITKAVKGEDEWCAEAYMETDYSKIGKEDFESVVKNFAIFKLMTGI